MVPFFSDALDLNTGAVYRDPTVLLVVFGPQEEIEQLLKPTIGNIADFSLYPEVDLHFEYDPGLSSPFLVVPEYSMQVAVVAETYDFSHVEELEFQDIDADELLAFDPADILVFQTSFLDIWAMSITSYSGLNPMEIGIERVTVVPEASSMVLMGFGLVGIVGLLKWRKNMKQIMMVLLFAAIAGMTGLSVAHSEVLYTSQNLSGHLVFAECNPGGATSCACSADDVSIASFEDYGVVISNVHEVPTYVNAIGYKKFVEVFPDGDPVTSGVYKYRGQVRLPVLPAPDVNQSENSQAVHLMMQLWDGRNALFQSNKTTLEGAIYWDLNPWSSPDGTIKVYTTNPVDNSLELFDTGISLPPDTAWHTFELVVDFVNQRYVSVMVDGKVTDLSSIELAKVYQPDWGEDVSLSITTESMAASPQADCTPIFTWKTQFKDAELSKEYLLTVKKAGTGRGTVLVGEQECDPDCTERSLPVSNHLDFGL